MIQIKAKHCEAEDKGRRAMDINLIKYGLMKEVNFTILLKNG